MPHRAGDRLGSASPLCHQQHCADALERSVITCSLTKETRVGRFHQQTFPIPLPCQLAYCSGAGRRRTTRSCSSDGQSYGEEGPLRSGCEGEQASRQTLKVLQTQGRGGAKHWGPGMPQRGMEGRCAGSCAGERENGAETRADSAILGGPGIFT